MLHRKGFARAALAMACVAGLAFAPSALAAPVEGPSGEAFYTAPSPLPEGGPGTLVWYRPTSINLNVELPSVKAWDVLYKSTGEAGEEIPVTGTVIVPTAAWSGSGPRPLVTYAEGTQGLGHQCAPSLQMAAGTEYDGGAIIASLKKGYAVAVTDYPGYTNGATPSYIAGKAEGHSVLDVVRAAQQLPGSGVSASAPVVIWGYSEGGHAAGWAGQLLHSYAPELHAVGVAAGGVPGNMQKIAEFNEGTPGSSLALDSVVGLAFAYSSIEEPESTLKEILSPEGLEVAAKLRHDCAIQALEAFHNVPFSSISKNHETFLELEKHDMVLESITNQQNLGGSGIPVPVYHYHGLQDEFVPVQQDEELHQAWCAKGVADDFQLYAGEHLLTDPTAIGHVMSWIEERIAGKPAPSTCGEHSGSELPAGARLTPETGDLIIQIPDWQIHGTVTSAKLGIPLNIPAGATLSAEGDITKGTLSASLFVPPINETLNIFGLVPVTISAELQQAGPITGTMGLSGSGLLSLKATGASNLIAKSIGILFFKINLGCRTSSPIEMPLSIEEPANALATGSLGFTDTVTIPSFTGCSPLNAALLTALLSGPGNKISITSEPPPPISW
jgi:pimeloyl-ACP methyl ester carboxylesterase